jgi:hypothetical protein
VPKDPVTSGNAEAGVFAYVQPDAARSGSMSRSVDEAWTGSWSIAAGDEAPWSQVELLLVIPALDHMAWATITTVTWTPVLPSAGATYERINPQVGGSCGCDHACRSAHERRTNTGWDSGA